MRLSRGLSFKMAKDDADGDASEGASHPRRRHRHRHHLSAPSNQPPVAGQPVEARSLSGITAIASNPPSYPRNPTQQKLDPLVLYIVRVPGSKGMRVRSLCSIYMLTTYEKKRCLSHSSQTTYQVERLRRSDQFIVVLPACGEPGRLRITTEIAVGTG